MKHITKHTCLKTLKEAEQWIQFTFLLNIYKTKHIKSTESIMICMLDGILLEKWANFSYRECEVRKKVHRVLNLYNRTNDCLNFLEERCF